HRRVGVVGPTGRLKAHARIGREDPVQPLEVAGIDAGRVPRHEVLQVPAVGQFDQCSAHGTYANVAFMDYEVEARARVAIEQLKYRYWRACDAKDPRGFRECFVASGGVVDCGPLGRTDPDTMVGIFEQIALATAADGGPRILDMHHGFMPSITIEPAGPHGGAPGEPGTTAEP